MSIISGKGQRPASRASLRRPLLGMALEPRLMFDAAAATTAAHAALDPTAKALIPTVPAPVMVRAADPTQDNGKTEVVFVDTSVSNWSALVTGIEKNKPGVEIDLIDGGQSGLAQIATWAESHSGYDAIHVVSAGSEAALELGADTITASSQSTAVAQAELAEIGTALKSGGELLLYGSNIGTGSDGQTLLSDLATDTGAVVAAANHAVGDPTQGGSWTLDLSTGSTSVTPLAISGYLGTLSIGAQVISATPTPVELQAANPSQDSGTLEVAFVDTSVTDWETLVSGIQSSRPGIEIELLDGTQSGLAQMAEWAGSHRGYDAIHVLSHGSEAELYLGTDAITDASLSSSPVQAELTEIGGALKTGGDLLVYGCDVAMGTDGQQFIKDLATDIGVVVAASTDVTGASALGGNWILEASTGSISVGSLSFTGYNDLLSDVTYNVTQFDNINDAGTSIGDTYFTFTGYVSDSSPSDSIVHVDQYGIYNDATNGGSNAELTITSTTPGDSFSIKSITVEEALTTAANYSITFNNSATVISSESVSDSNHTSTDSSWDYYTFTFTPTTVTSVTIHMSLTNDGGTGYGVGNLTGVAQFVTGGYPAVGGPAISSTAYDAHTGNLTLTGTNFTTGGSSGYTTGDLTLTGKGSGTYTLSSTNDTVTSETATSAVIHLSTADQATVDALLNATGTSASDSTAYNLNAGAGWDTSATLAATNAVAVSDSGTDSVSHSGTTAPTDTTGGTTPVAVDNGSITVADSTSASGGVAWDSGAKLVASIGATNADTSHDELLVGNVGLITDTAGVIKYNGTTIGTVSGANTGLPGHSLEIDFSGTATDTQVAALINALEFKDTAATNAGDRTVSITLTDGYGKATSALSDTVHVSNNPPAIATSAFSLTGINDSTTSAAVTVATLLSDAGYTDADGTSTEGLAITAKTVQGTGTWQYSLNDSSWTTVGAVSTAAALQLDQTDYIRYVPSSGGTGNVTLSFVGWDETNGGTVATTASSTHTATGAFSSTASTATIAVSATVTNHAPTVTSGSFSAAATTTGSAEVITVATLLSGAGYGDVDGTATEGMAVTGLTAGGGGTWAWSTNGSTWNSLSSASVGTALLLDATYSLKFTPTANDTGTATLSFQGWDETTGSAGSTASASSSGGSTAFSTATAVANILANDAPTLSTTAITAPRSLSTGATTWTVSTLLTDAGYGDSDTNVTTKGIAITGLSTGGGGTWAWSSDGSTFTTIAGPSAAAALLLDSTDQIRFTPTAATEGTATISFQGWDESTGTASSGTTARTGAANSNGTSTAYSTASATLSLVVNAAPTVTAGSFSAGSTTLDAAVTVTVSTLLTDAGYADDASSVKGIAVTGLNAGGGGVWSWSSDSGAHWNTITSPSASAAVLLDAGDELHFSPNAGSSGTASISFQGWDETTGTASVLTTTNTLASTYATTGAFSTNTASAQLLVNTAPTVTSGSFAGTSTTYNTPDVITVASLLTGSGYADADTTSTKGIAITGLSAGSGGSWEWSTGNGTWTSISGVTTANALLLDSADEVRYTPNTSTPGTASLSFQGWDETNGGTIGSTGNSTTSTGGATAFSTATATVTVAQVNVAPTVTAGSFSAGSTTAAADTVSVATLLTDAGYADSDVGQGKGIAITGYANGGGGTWSWSSDNVTFTAFSGANTGAAVLLDSSDYLRFTPTASTNGVASINFQGWDETSSGAASSGVTARTAASTYSASGAFSTNTAIAQIAVNTAPTASGTFTAASINAAGGNGTPFTVNDILAGITYATDTGATHGIALAGETGSGTWQFSTDSGTTWASVGAVTSSAALLLDGTAELRYVPSATRETATLTFNVWDETSGTASVSATSTLHTVDLSTGGATGGSTAFSNTTALVDETTVNAAPSLTGGPATLTGTSEGATASSATLVSTIIAGVTDTDLNTGDAKGIAITGESGNGTWQYSSDGTNWASLGSIGTSSALLLAGTDSLRYVPNDASVETASLTFHAWDETTGANSTTTGGVATRNTADLTTTGGTTAFSSGSALANLAVVNDAPTASTTAFSLGTTADNAVTSGIQISTFLASAGYGDLDLSDAKGIAITGSGGVAGSWAYSTDNVTWTSIGAVSATNALLLDGSDYVRFTPTLRQDGTATLSFRAWDETSGTASANNAASDLSTASNGGSTAFSTNIATGDLSVTTSNLAPTLSGTDSATAITAGGGASAGVLVSTILGTAGISYADANDADNHDPHAIAISGASGAGTWQYSTDGGADWASIGPVSNTAALLLDSTAEIRYVPAATTTETATLTIHGWDETSGTASVETSTTTIRNTGNVSTNGSTTAFSTGTATLSQAVLNNAPSLSGGPYVLAGTTNESNSASAASPTVATILAGLTDTDLNTNDAKGIAITGETGAGTWQFSTDGGAHWANIGTTVSTSSALLLAGTAELRYEPSSTTPETATLTIHAWDETTGSASVANGTTTLSTADLTTTGGSTAYSSGSATAEVVVLDVPHLANINAVAAITGTSTGLDLGGSLISDSTVSGNNVQVVLTGSAGVTLSVPTTGLSSTSGDGSHVVTLTGSLSAVDAALASASYTSVAGYAGTDAVGVQVTDLTSGGTASGSVALTVEKAPVLTLASTQATADATLLSIGGNAITDTTLGSGSLSVTVSAGHGILNLATENGLTSVSGDGTGAITLVGDLSHVNAALATLGYTSNAYYNAADSIAVAATDEVSGLTGNGSITVNVSHANIAPTVSLPAAQSTNDNTNLVITGVAVADVDSQGGTEQVTVSVGHGSITLAQETGLTITAGAEGSSSITVTGTIANIDAALNGLTYKSTLYDNAADTLTVAVNDEGNSGNGGALSNSGNLTINVNHTDIAPTITLPGSTNVADSNTALAISGLSVGDVDAQGGNLTVTLTDGDGSVALATTANLASVTGNGSGLVTLTGTLSQLNTALATLTFTPTTNYLGEADISVGVNDLGNLGSGGAQTASATIDVSVINHAPSLSGGPLALTATTTSLAGSATTVSALLGELTTADADSGDARGIAVTATVGDGNWQYSTGAGWVNFGTVSAGNALLLDGATQIRYNPNGSTAEQASLTFAAWDETSGTATGHGNATSNGGATAYSTATASATIIADTAPGIGGGTTGQATGDNASLNPLSSVTVTDPDTGAMTATVTITNGVNRGDFTNATGWTRTVNGADIVYTETFAAGADIGQTVQTAVEALTFQPLEHVVTVGQSETTSFSVSVHDSYYTASDAQAISVVATAVNDAPVLSGAGQSLVSIQPLADSTPVSVSSLLAQLSDTDIDANAVKGIAVTGTAEVDHATGLQTAASWQFSTNGGTSWTDFGAVSATNALLLDGAALIRYAGGSYNEQATLTFHAWDETSGSASASQTPSYANASVTGGHSTFSTGASTLAIQVESQPVIGSSGTTALQPVTDIGGLDPLADVTVTDPDDAGITATVTIVNGVNRGDFTNANGWTRTVNGNDIIYTETFAAGPNIGLTVQQAVAALTFQPRSHQINVGTTEDTTFTLSVATDLYTVSNPGTISVRTTASDTTPTVTTASAPADYVAPIVGVPGSGAKVIDNAFTVTDPDDRGSGNPGNGTLSVAVTQSGSATDQLAIATGTGITVSAQGVVSDQGTVIGQIDSTANGTGLAGLVVHLAANTTDAQLSDLGRAITYASPGTNSSAQRSVVFTVTDGGGAHASVTDLVNVTVPLPLSAPTTTITTTTTETTTTDTTTTTVVSVPVIAPVIKQSTTEATATSVTTTTTTTVVATATFTDLGGSNAPAFHVEIVPSTGNGATLVVVHPMQDVILPTTTHIEVPVPSDVFATTSADNAVSLAAVQSNGQALPGWLTFDSANGKFVGTPPTGFDGVLKIKVTATDAQGHKAEVTFDMHIGEAGGSVQKHGALPITAHGKQAALIGRPGLGAQLKLAGGGHAQHLAQRQALVEAARRLSAV